MTDIVPFLTQSKLLDSQSRPNEKIITRILMDSFNFKSLKCFSLEQTKYNDDLLTAHQAALSRLEYYIPV